MFGPNDGGITPAVDSEPGAMSENAPPAGPGGGGPNDCDGPVGGGAWSGRFDGAPVAGADMPSSVLRTCGLPDAAAIAASCCAADGIAGAIMPSGEMVGSSGLDVFGSGDTPCAASGD